jgi:hypothetical protein
VIAAIGSVVTFLVAIKVPGLYAGLGAAITTFLTATIIALTTRPIAPPLFTAAVSAGAALFSGYGIEVSNEVVASVSALVLAGLALFAVRPQVTPAGDPRPIDGFDVIEKTEVGAVQAQPRTPLQPSGRC